jgi:hypothetical protein
MGSNNYKKSTSASNTKDTGKRFNPKDRKQSYAKKTYSKDKFDKYDTKASGSNDPAWYAANQSLLRDAASIPYSWSVGTPIDMMNPLNLTASDRKLVIPGIQVQQLVPSVGKSTDSVSPINLASNATYAFIRHANSGHANYDAPDLMLYIMSMSQIYSYICFLQRAYGCMTLYSQKNRYLPDALLQAMRIDKSCKDHMSDLRYGINVLINKAASFAVPADMTIFQRQAFLYSNIYTEGPSMKNQLYMFVPGGFWKYNWNTTDSAGELIMRGFSAPDGATVQKLLDFGNELLNVLIQDEDINVMSGDILKAYGSDGIIKLAPLTTEYPIVPIYNLEVLEQMKNATALTPVLGGSIDYSVKQDPTHAFLLSKPMLTVTSLGGAEWINDAWRQSVAALASNKIITTSVAEATSEVTMENTRLTLGAYGYVFTSGTSATIYLDCGSEICLANEYWYYKNTTTAGVDVLTLTYTKSSFEEVQALSTTIDANSTDKLFVANNFKFHPCALVNLFQQNGATNFATYLKSLLYFDVDNYAVLTSQDIARLHEAALLNELHVPFIAKVGS